MRITIATGPFYPTPPVPTGAVQRIWTDLGFEFARRGHHVTILACTYPGQAKNEVVSGVHIRRRTGLRQGKNIYLDILKDSWYSFRTSLLLPKADIIVSNAFWLPVLTQLRQKHVGKLVVHIARVPKGQLGLYRKTSAFDTVSEAMRDDILAQAPWAKGRVRVVPNPIDLGYFAPPASPPAAGPRAGGASRTVLFTGRVHPEKGLHLLVDACARLRRSHPDIRLRLVGAQRVNEGGGGDEYVAKLRGLARDLPLAIDAPIYDRKGLADALRAADLYCYPSLAEKGEAFGVAPLEAMATGIAPVVSNLACFKQFLVDDQNGLVFDHRASDPAGTLAEKLDQLLSDPARARAMGERAARRATDFGIPAVAEMHLRDFEQILESRP